MATTSTLPGKFLVRDTKSNAKLTANPLLTSNVSLSFWGGIDPLTGIVVDTSHPLHGICVSDTILCLPSGRGSCTASQVLLELILNHKAPKAFCFRDVDGLACVGAIIAQEVFGKEVPNMIHIGSEAFGKLLNENASHGCVLPNGDLVMGGKDSLAQELANWKDDNSTEAIPDLKFTETEQAMIDSSTTEAQRMAYRVLFQYAHLGATEPPSYRDITQAHIDGCTYIGPGGLEFTQRLVQANGKVVVPTTLNSVSADRRHHETLAVPADYAANSIALGDAYLGLGCQPSFTCAPYLLPTEPKLGDQIAWGESNAVVFANSVLGARTEKYADYLDICCALTGKVPATGVHLDQNRKPQIVLDASDMMKKLADQLDDKECRVNLEMLFPTLGHLCGSLSDGKVPVLVGLNTQQWESLVNKDHLKAFCAAFGTTGTSPLVHIEGITPETKQNPNLTKEALRNCPSKTVTWDQCEETFALLNNDATAREDDRKIDLIALGNPHLSVEECGNLVSLIKSMASSSAEPPKKHPSVRIMACLSREIHGRAVEQGYIQYLTDFGVEFINDTCWCMLLDPPIIPPEPDATILTNSGKYAHYGPGLTGRKFRYGSTEDCVQVAITGEYPSRTSTTSPSKNGLPGWLLSRPFLQQARAYSTTAYAAGSTGRITQIIQPVVMSSRLHTNAAVFASRRTVGFGRYALQFVRHFLKR